MKRKKTSSPTAETPKYRPKKIDIAGLTAKNGDLIRRTFADGIHSLSEVFSARRTCLNNDGDFVDLGPDYPKRMAGLQTLLNLCTRGREPFVAPEPRTGVYVDEHRNALKEYTRREPEKTAKEYERVAVRFKFWGADRWQEQDFPEGKIPNPAIDIPEPEITHAGPVPQSPSEPDRICDLTDTHGEEIEELFRIGLESIRDVFSARKLKLNRDGGRVDLGPDHDVRFAAMHLFMNLSTRGRKAIPTPPHKRKPPTYEECELLLSRPPDLASLQCERAAEEQRRKLEREQEGFRSSR
jgi:hypothetical protein